MRETRRLAGMAAALACSLANIGWAQAGAGSQSEPYLKVSYGLALGRCSGNLTLHPDGRFSASTYFDDKEQRRSGKTDPAYWDLAVAGLKENNVKDIESRDFYSHTVPDDDPAAEAKLIALRAATDYIILDGHAFTLDWQDEEGERIYLYDAKTRWLPMWKRLVRDVRLEKMTCGHYLQQMFFPE